MGFSVSLNKYVGVIAALLLVAFGIVIFRKRRQISHSTQPKPSRHQVPISRNPYQPHGTSPSTNTNLQSPPIAKHPPFKFSQKRPSILDGYKVTIVETIDACEEFLATKVPAPVKMVGLDCEWRSGGLNKSRNASSNSLELREEEESEDLERKRFFSEEGLGPMRSDCPVALLQLAFSNGELVLVRLCKMRGIGVRLRNMLSDRSILKFGVGISNDVKKLAAGFVVETLGCVDLQKVAVRCGIRTNTSLNGLSQTLLGTGLDKSFHLRCGDWEVDKLSKKQIDYAATDAAVALHLLQALVEIKLTRHDRRESVAGLTRYENEITEPTRTHSEPHLSHIANQNSPLSSHDRQHSNLIGRSIEAWLLDEERSTCLSSLCQGVVDVLFKQRRNSKTLPPLLEGESPTGSRKTNAYSVRKSRLYHNCRLLAPDGQLLSTMQKKKLEWYLERDLGTLLSESPMTVQLHFEPAGRPGVDREYYLREKENICAVCGTDQNCVRKNIVPHEYRRHFSPQLKEHLSHDILLLCVTCHQLASHHNALLKRQVAMEYGLGAQDNSSQKYSGDPELRKVRNHARVLLKATDNIPSERVQVLQETVASYHGVPSSEITREMIEEASEVDSRSPNSGYMSHAEMVVAALLREGGNDKLFEFQQRWRQHFLDTMNPKFLPECWSVDHNPN